MMRGFYIICFITLCGCCKTYINIETLKQPLIVNSESLDASTGNIVKEKLLFSKPVEKLTCKRIEIYENSVPSGNDYVFTNILRQTCNSDCSWRSSYDKIVNSNIIQEMCRNSDDTLILFMVEGHVSDTGSTTAYCNQSGFCSSSKVYAISQTFYPLTIVKK